MVFCISLSVVYFLNVTFSRLITSVGDICYRLLVFLFLFLRSSSFFGCLGKAALFCCGTLGLGSPYTMQTRPCNVDPHTPHFYIVKLGFTGVYIFFLIFALKHRLWVLVRTASVSEAVLTCTHNLCLGQK